MYSQEFILQLATPELNLGVHSLRLGGTTVAINSDVKEGRRKRLPRWKMIGRWKGDSSKDGYMVDYVTNRLEIAKQLGL